MNTQRAIEVMTVREILRDQQAAIVEKDARIKQLENALTCIRDGVDDEGATFLTAAEHRALAEKVLAG